MSFRRDQNSRFNRDETRRKTSGTDNGTDNSLYASRADEQRLICLLSSGTKVKPGLFDTRVVCDFDEQTTRKKLLLLNLN